MQDMHEVLRAAEGRFFFYGTLRDPCVRERVLGRPVPAAMVHTARLAGWAVRHVAGESYPMIVPAPGEVAEGVVIEGATAGDLARLVFFEDGDDYRLERVTVTLAGGRQVAAAMFHPTDGAETGLPWDFAAWRTVDGGLMAETLVEFMEWFGRRPADEAHGLWKWAECRALARLEGRRSALPATVRRVAGPGDVETLDIHRIESGIFTLERRRMRHRRFDGTLTPPFDRLTFHTGDSVTVLPWDPDHDTVLVVEQFRAAPFAREDANPWLIEPVAGRRDGPESWEEVARREALEEAGIRLGRMKRIAGYYPSPGVLAEYLVSFVAEADLGPAGDGGLHGLAEEQEDIRAHVLPLADLVAMIGSGEAADGPLILSALWLAASRERLRAEWGRD